MYRAPSEFGGQLGPDFREFGHRVGRGPDELAYLEEIVVLLLPELFVTGPD